jgi:hypothetical protein
LLVKMHRKKASQYEYHQRTQGERSGCTMIYP